MADAKDHLVEYRVRPVTRYQVTRYEGAGGSGSVRGLGIYDSEQVAYEVGYALCRADHERLGYPLDDGRVRYPDPVFEGVPSAIHGS